MSRIILHLLLIATCSARLAQPGHQLSADGASADANPEVDAWWEAEKSKIEADCDEMMRKLDAEKRQKLQDIVDAARRQVELELQKLRDAEASAQGELKELEQAKDVAKKVRKPRLGPSRDLIAEQEAKIRELERLIAEKKACIDELRKAEQDLLDAKKKLAEAQKMVADAEAAHASQKEEVDKEKADIPPAEMDLDLAEEELERAKARHAAAARRLDKAKADLREHDMEGTYNSLKAEGARPVSAELPDLKDLPSAADSSVSFHANPNPSMSTPAKSASRHVAAGGAAATLAVLFMTALRL